MPRAPRPRCAGCNKVVENLHLRLFSNILLKLFVSARTQKRIDSASYICHGCRSKFDRWYRKVKDEIDEFYLNENENAIENHDDLGNVILKVFFFV